MRKVIVTGAARGLGAAIAARFAHAGARVLLVDRDPVHESAELPGSCHVLQYDLTRASCGEDILAEAARHLGGCDTLINNAAWSFHRPFLEVTPDEFDRLVAVNQRAPFLLSQAFARALQTSATLPLDPCIVNISSVNAISGNVNLVAYAGTKGALEAMTRAMAVELASHGIRVNGVRPGVIDTENAREAIARIGEDYWRDFLMHEATSPDDLAEIVTWLCSAAAKTVTGSVWTVDSGYSAH